ncbi:monovalent cation/H+ antiporter complex subunit F [Streptomyces fagopyri]|uniref:monovalent cation/H+ antiporter complex subunit F n=1 Tax=Streptomyces fagopyri TaxID=2662397 RepID=UPI0033F5B016
MLLCVQGYDRPAYADLALVLAVLGPVGTLVYARLLADDLGSAPPSALPVTVVTIAATSVVVTASCVAVGPSRAAVKLVVIGGLLVAGNVITSRALSDPNLGRSEVGRD